MSLGVWDRCCAEAIAPHLLEAARALGTNGEPNSLAQKRPDLRLMNCVRLRGLWSTGPLAEHWRKMSGFSSGSYWQFLSKAGARARRRERPGLGR